MARAVQYSAGPAYGEQGYDVCDEFENQKLRSYIRYDTKNEIIEVEPLEPYSTNEYYFLTITKNVKSRGGQSLKEPVQIKFKL